MGDLGEQKGQIMQQAAEDALTFYCSFWSQKKGRGLGGGSSCLWRSGSTSDLWHLRPFLCQTSAHSRESDGRHRRLYVLSVLTGLGSCREHDQGLLKCFTAICMGKYQTASLDRLKSYGILEPLPYFSMFLGVKQALYWTYSDRNNCSVGLHCIGCLHGARYTVAAKYFCHYESFTPKIMGK